MRPYRRIERGTGLLVFLAGAALGGNAGATTAAGSSICARLVTQMRDAPATVVKDANIRGAWSPWIRYAERVSSDSGAFRRIDAEWAAQMPGHYAPPLTDIKVLPGTGLFVANAVLGSGDCLNATFMEWKSGAHPRVIPGPQLPLDMCARDNNPSWGHLALVLGQPAYVGTRSLNERNNDSLLLISRWTGTNWTAPCSVSIRFTYRYRVTQLYCAASNQVCNAARKVMPEVQRRYNDYNVRVFDALNEHNPTPKFRFHRTPDRQEQALDARARHLGLPMRIAHGSRARPLWLRHLNRYDAVYFSLRLDGRLYVGAADVQRYPERGTFYYVLRAPNAHARQLEPLAVYTVRRMSGGIASIQARNASTLPEGS